MNASAEDYEYLKKLTVLYVEDDEEVLNQSSQFLSRFVGVLLTARNGAEGLAAYREHHPHIVITDKQMPVMDGLAMASEIRNLDRSVPIIVLTSFELPDVLIKSINISIDRYITKPADGFRLHQALLSCAPRLREDEQLKPPQGELKDDLRRLNCILEGTRAGTWEWNVQTGETIFNGRWAELVGYHLDEISPVSISTWINLVHPDDLIKSNELLHRHFRGESDCYECEVRMRHKNGQWVWMLDRGVVASRTDDGKPLWMFGAHMDITERKQMEEMLRVSEERHRLLADNASDVIWTMGLDLKYTYVSPSVAKLRGYSPAEVMQQPIEEALTPESYLVAMEHFATICTSIQAGRPVENIRGKLEQTCSDGSTVWTEITVSCIYNSEGTFVEILGVTRDITELKKTQQQLELMAHYDALTNLPNRSLFSDLFSQGLALARRHNTRLALLFMDIDNFKLINDNYGHAVGDLILQEVAARMLCCIRASDTIGRIGGDEFVVLLHDVGSDENAVTSADKIRDVLNQSFGVAGKTFSISSSIGIAIYPEHGSEAIELSRNADRAMYHAKECGRNNVKVFNAGILPADPA
ncbi:MAG: diguanylate cyclase [Desulfuromonadaceae bacterium]|nr:diguanylate cyclase [Desulfuromonadaceae bacterium]